MPIDLAAFERAESARRVAALVDGRHYTAYVQEVKALREAGDDDAAAGLLLRLIEAVEREAANPLAGHVGVPRWYFDQLAAIYRKARRDDLAGPLIQRWTVLQVKAETDGLRLLAQMRASVPASEPTPGVGPSPRVKRAAFKLGRLVGLLFRKP